MKAEDIIPEHDKGIKTNTESTVELANEEEAKEFYKLVKNRLLNVNKWHDLAGAVSADFHLADKEGHEVNRWAQAGDHLKISIPAPGSVTGQGYDWVQIEEIKEKDESILILVRPATNPLNKREDIAHFFD